MFSEFLFSINLKTVNIDDLVYGYSGNQLKRVEDAGSSSGFKNGASVVAEYLYDANGNMTRDLNKGIKDIKYNELNLPESISFADGRKISYIYDYNICDHLGNVRAVVDAAGTVKQQSNYYPFGGVFAQAGKSDNKYLYNGKEKQEGTDWLDYGARMYDPSLGRWHNIDSDAENYFAYGPYVYVGNNPIRRIDPDGNDGWDVVKGAFAAVVDNASCGLINLRRSMSYNDASDYNTGQDIGDISSVVAGSSMEVGGGGMVAAGVVGVEVSLTAEVASVGVATPVVAVTGTVSGTLILGGTVVAAEGHILQSNGAANLSNKKGRVSEEKSSRENITKVYSTRKRAKDSRPKPKSANKGQKQVTRQSRNKKGEGNKMKTDGKQTQHFHDSNHNNKNKTNVHYRTTKKIRQ